jgi:hypothetical protein
MKLTFPYGDRTVALSSSRIRSLAVLVVYAISAAGHTTDAVLCLSADGSGAVRLAAPGRCHAAPDPAIGGHGPRSGREEAGCGDPCVRCVHVPLNLAPDGVPLASRQDSSNPSLEAGLPRAAWLPSSLPGSRIGASPLSPAECSSLTALRTTVLRI